MQLSRRRSPVVTRRGRPDEAYLPLLYYIPLQRVPVAKMASKFPQRDNTRTPYHSTYSRFSVSDSAGFRGSLSRTRRAAWRCHRQRAWLGPLGRLMSATSFLHRQRDKALLAQLTWAAAGVGLAALELGPAGVGGGPARDLTLTAKPATHL